MKREGRRLWVYIIDKNVIWRLLLLSLVYNWDFATLSLSIFETWSEFFKVDITFQVHILIIFLQRSSRIQNFFRSRTLSKMDPSRKCTMFILQFQDLLIHYRNHRLLPSPHPPAPSQGTLICGHTSYLPLKQIKRASLVAQWLRICLPMQGTWVWALDREDPTAAEQLSPCTTTTEPAL